MDTVNTMKLINPLVSVIMPVYNGADFLKDAIESVLRQTYTNFELIIVNDFSKDNSYEIIKEYFYDKRIISVLNEKNYGVAKSRNIAMEYSSGDFITFLDQDDVWLKNKLFIQVSAIQKNPELGLLHSKYARIDASGNVLKQFCDVENSDFENEEANLVKKNVFEEIFISNDIQPLTTMIPRKVLSEVGLFKTDLPGVDDYEMWLRIAKDYEVGHLETVLGYWRYHDKQQSNQGYKMLTLRLKAINYVLSESPDVKKMLSSKHFNTRMHSLNSNVGNYYFYNIQDYNASKLYFIQAIKYNIKDVDSFVKLCYCYLPNSFRLFFRQSKHLIKTIVS